MTRCITCGFDLHSPACVAAHSPSTTPATTDVRPDYYRVLCQARNPETGLYVKLEVECFDLIDALFKGHPAAFYLGNALKYLFRVGRKSPEQAEDLRKVSTYAKQAIERSS